jgi:nicotinate-nucleotide adenylyltransferase
VAEGTARLGIFGGTFNPVHMGHLIAAQCAFEHLELSRVLFVPCARSPHKLRAPLLDARHRLAMLSAAIEGDLRYEVSDIEVRRGGVSYAIDTVEELRREYPDAELCFIIGADTLRDLHAWRAIDRLLALCRFVTLERPGHASAPDELGLDPPWPERLCRDVVPGRLIEISSSDLRHRVAEGLSIRYLVPPAVEMYIAEHGLYG